MATKEQIVKAILDVAGNPAVGEVRDLAEAFADAVVAIDTPAKEVRVVEVKETRQLFPFLATTPTQFIPFSWWGFFYARIFMRHALLLFQKVYVALVEKPLGFLWWKDPQGFFV